MWMNINTKCEMCGDDAEITDVKCRDGDFLIISCERCNEQKGKLYKHKPIDYINESYNEGKQ